MVNCCRSWSDQPESSGPDTTKASFPFSAVAPKHLYRSMFIESPGYELPSYPAPGLLTKCQHVFLKATEIRFSKGIPNMLFFASSFSERSREYPENATQPLSACPTEARAAPEDIKRGRPPCACLSSRSYCSGRCSLPRQHPSPITRVSFVSRFQTRPRHSIRSSSTRPIHRKSINETAIRVLRWNLEFR